MKKVITGVAVVVTSLILMGCGANNTPPADTTGNTNVPVADDVAPASDVAKLGDLVKVDYVGTLEDGTVFDTSLEAKAKEVGSYDINRPYEALPVQLGKGDVIPGFEQGIVGMKVGETKTVSLSIDEAYGQPRPELIQKIPADTFSGSDIIPEVGKSYNFGIAQGTILEVSETEVTIDFNHPLAGKALNFEITLKEIMPAGSINEPVAPEAPAPSDDAADATGDAVQPE